ncbi:hypothetical protein P43SY_010159 [Pythium insidiosum]|uniref:Uncharacterized protein n=1 Tax=Pythium insidiosum TaxID=114742 RepID=A0AAD5Q5X5_PYTIN|nr:hypothetical protein P43SY_010159 [Pythium insidiosum]
MNRVGSSPDLPLHNAWSSVVYSSSKRRQLLKPTNGNGASPQLAALQRRRLIPLPIDLRTGTLKRDAIADVGGRLNGSVSMSALPEPQASSDAAGMSEDDRMNYEITVASLKQRITVLEKELATTSKRSVKLERQLTATTKENQDLHGANAVLRAKTEELERAVMQQRHAFDKLAERYATAYANMERLAETASSSDVSSTLNVVVQTLSRENVELQRKVRVLEARHSEDKTIVANQEQRLKRLRAEMEALQHMNDTHQKQASETVAGSKSTRDISSSAAGSGSSSGAGSGSSSGLGSASAQGSMKTEDCQYIDPNILKILEKLPARRRVR